jgi:hypothetical protein
MSMRLFIVGLVLCWCNISSAASAAIRAGGGALVRDGGPDGIYRVGANARLENGLQLHLQIAGDFTSEKLIPPNQGPQPPHVDEWQFLGGFGYRAANSERFYIDGLFLLGPRILQFSDATHGSIMGELVCSFGIRLGEGLAIELRGAPGWEKKVTALSPDGTASWHRGNLFIEVGAMLAYDFDPHAGEHEPLDF